MRESVAGLITSQCRGHAKDDCDGAAEGWRSHDLKRCLAYCQRYRAGEDADDYGCDIAAAAMIDRESSGSANEGRERIDGEAEEKSQRRAIPIKLPSMPIASMVVASVK
ncbi:hypothetical protein [Methylovirgula sp. HY1]|uniref:hypothetical protein n=1 Tax=Methylovirgula sp. HY1 TaxID=2822761 RepID=UPI001C5A83EE|nr:hypothetical protein [Methylovirgula sp. HY1]